MLLMENTVSRKKNKSFTDNTIAIRNKENSSSTMDYDSLKRTEKSLRKALLGVINGGS